MERGYKDPMGKTIKPVILGGDMSTYPLAREFHEAFGVTSVCVAPAPIKIIEESRIIDICRVPSMDRHDLKEAIVGIAQENGDKTVVLMANSDAVVDRLETFADELPENVVSSLPPRALMERVSDKIEFAKLCDEYGLDAPHSEIVDVAAAGPIAPTGISFPLVAKPAVSSAEYFKLFARGFKKVYFLQSQAELDQLWRDLRAERFSGRFLVQELIGGDDTYVDMITLYMNRLGKATMFVSSQVLLEDHAPALFGNPVAMITRPMPELWHKVERMLSDLGWRGFANFDMKRDPKTGREIFMDFNPRIGANSYYACAGGVNPALAVVSDLVDGFDDTVQQVSRKALYSRAAPTLIRHYLRDPELVTEFNEIVSKGLVFNPMRYQADTLRARAIGFAMEANYIRKFRRYYPEPTETSF